MYTQQRHRKFCCLFLTFAVITVCILLLIYWYLVDDLHQRKFFPLQHGSAMPQATYHWPLVDRFSSPMTKDDLRSLELTLGTLLSELNRLNVTYFMIYGTLLGSYRHHGRIPWDDDVDLMLNSSDKKRIYVALTALKPHYGLYLRYNFNSPHQWKFFPLQHGSPMPKETYHWPFVDLFFFRENNMHVWSPLQHKYRWPRSVIFPLRQRPFDKLWIPAPCNVLHVLTTHYDVSVCERRSYSHVYDKLSIPWRSVAVDCSTLAHRYPMVVRQSTTTDTGSRQIVSESLVLGNRILQTITVESGC